jgi:predicted patatin/cPLA2 family phospholipase
MDQSAVIQKLDRRKERLDSASVSRLLFSRQRDSSVPSRRTDGRRIALVIEGGAMRGVVSAGMVSALEQIGLRNCFDTVYGSSAGSISGAYFVAGQARYGTTIFYDNINNRRFINLWRLALGRPIVSLEYLLDDVCANAKPLPADRTIFSDVPLRIVASSLREKKATILGDFASRTELVEALRASARIPFFAGKPVAFRGDTFLDASIYQSIPYRAALAEGATDLVILLTRQFGDLRDKPNWVDRNIIGPYLGAMDKDLMHHYLDRANEYRSEMDAIENLSKGNDGVHTLIVQTMPWNPKISPLETSREKLLGGAMAGHEAVYSALGLPAPRLAEIIAPVMEAAPEGATRESVHAEVAEVSPSPGREK